MLGIMAPFLLDNPTRRTAFANEGTKITFSVVFPKLNLIVDAVSLKSMSESVCASTAESDRNGQVVLVLDLSLLHFKCVTVAHAVTWRRPVCTAGINSGVLNKFTENCLYFNNLFYFL